MDFIFNDSIILEKFPGKGGWTIARINISAEVKRSFGQVKVKGQIDHYELTEAHLMPLGNGQLFLPVNASIRKVIKKEAGNSVKITLFPFENSFVLPEMFLECLEDEPEALNYFQTFTEQEKQHYLDWIFSTDKEEEQIERIAKSIDDIAKGYKLKFTVKK